MKRAPVVPRGLKAVSGDRGSSSASVEPAAASPAQVVKQFYVLREILAMYPGLREDHLRYLAKWAVITPVPMATGIAYGFADLAVIRQAHADLSRGISFRAAVRSALAERHGQLSLDFRPGADRSQTAKVIALPRGARRPDTAAGAVPVRMARTEAAAAFLEGFALDDGNPATQEQALAAYRRTLEIDPDMVPALVNLGNVHYAREERVEARAIYERALRLDPGCFEAQFNLGHVFHDTSRYDLAEECYRKTIALNPGFPDAHFYLAVTLEKTGRSQEAKPHWRAYQHLAPDGEWVELAREFSD